MCDDSDLEADQKKKQEILPLAVQMYDRSIPLPILRSASQSKRYSAENRQLLAKAAWAKAILVGNEPMALALAKDLVTSDKEYAPYYRSYLKAATPSERRFAAAFAMLHDDNCSFLVGQSQWWWSALAAVDISSREETSLDDRKPDLNSLPFLSVAERAAAAADLAKLKKLSAAPAYLGAIVVDWAKSHPQEVRVPEALHLAVRCTHYGERDNASAKLCKEAFLILHHRYPRSEWTKETPYYY
jgi:hypothetical protein